ncbi:ImmA/IrrE family metallo-endopeptidase [Enterococcus sp. LJL128]
MTEQVDEYLNFSDKINDFLSALMVAENLHYEDYYYSYVWDYVKEKGVAIRGFSFDGIAKERISGMIVQDGLETTIGYNQNMVEKRKNFTISHEITHYLFHLNEENPIFTDTENSLHYSYNEILHEFQANIGASAILIPDVVLFRFLKKGWSLSSLSQHFGISESALYIRLIQTMQAYFNVSYIAAKTNADNIRYKFYGKGKSTAAELGKNLESRLLRTNRFIEALG